MIFADTKHLFDSHRRIFSEIKKENRLMFFYWSSIWWKTRLKKKLLFKRNTHYAFVLKHHRAHCRKSKFALLLSKKWAIRCLHEKMDTLNQHAHISKRSLFIEFNFLLQKTEKILGLTLQRLFKSFLKLT